jgi:valyl-tRNA synthetase
VPEGYHIEMTGEDETISDSMSQLVLMMILAVIFIYLIMVVQFQSLVSPFTIVMPPPNITGQLHMGHALDNTMQDILIRYKRMQGYNALWQPGTDHASIATEVKVIQSLKEQGINKADLTREEFLDKCWEWRKEYGGRIVKQLRKLGSSADWQRERFTMDEGCSHAVQEVFTKLYKKGWIYKGSRIVNWCPVCKTSISDAEVEHEEQDGFFWHINYPVVGEEGRFVEIATTRPETLFGDTAVAVNPEDERYKDIVGKTLKLPMTDREIPVIADAYVDKEFGTGCVKITPAHDPNDFEVGKRHNLEEIVVINDDATMNEKAGKYAGMDRYECRKLCQCSTSMNILLFQEFHVYYLILLAALFFVKKISVKFTIIPLLPCSFPDGTYRRYME